MSINKKLVVPILLVLVLVAAGLVWVKPALFGKHSAHAASSLPYNATANGPYSVKGNTIVGADGRQYIFHGIGRDGLEYNCSGEGPLDQAHLAYMGSGANSAGATYWDANTVRLPVSEGFWLNGAPGYPCTAAQYQALVTQTVNSLTALKLNVIIDLQWTDAAHQSLQGGGPWGMPDADSVTFWQQVAPIFKGYSNVLFELYNEPHPPSWSCWASGCNMSESGYSDDCKCSKTLSYPGVGMQALVNAVRGAGANNLVLVGGMNWGYDLSQVGSYPLSGSNIVYDTHPYPYGDKLSNTWDASFGNISSKYPVLSAESGEFDCTSTYLNQLYSYFDAHSIGWVSWAWVSRGDTCGYPELVTDYQGTPSVSMGQFIYQKLHSYASAPPFAGPSNKTWYFAEGRVGGGFKEFLTLGNTDPSNDCTVNLQYLLQGGNPVSKTVTVPHASRLTESVNDDLGIPYNGGASASVSTIASVTGGCNGIVAERPMYFSWHGINSGSDVMGATHLGKTFYFGDVPTGSGYTSFITILNPPGGQPATVTATYYVGGRAVGLTQTVTVPAGQRGTIAPTNTGLPTHVAAIVTSTQPVMVERPDYFSTSAGNAGYVAGATSVVGVQSLAHDWLFAEGYTGGSFQEYLVIANLDTTAKAAATVTINLESDTGTVKTSTITVNSMDQVVWNVNQGMSGSNVSAEVTSPSVNIVVEREMFFHYGHTVPNAFAIGSTGGTDVIGQVGPASVTSYAFAEGYSNIGYNEWLTLQNPTSNDETIYISLVNGYGSSYVPGGFLVHAHSRYTVDVSALVWQNLAMRGDDHRGYEVSMTVRTTQAGAAFVAERPMYWNAGGTQGGTDVLGYTGN
jgi:endoglucanase